MCQIIPKAFVTSTYSNCYLETTYYFTIICEFIIMFKNPIIVIVIYAVRYKGLGVALGLTDSHR